MPPVASLSHATVIRLGQVVGATHVVIGSFRLTGGCRSPCARRASGSIPAGWSTKFVEVRPARRSVCDFRARQPPPRGCRRPRARRPLAARAAGVRELHQGTAWRRRRRRRSAISRRRSSSIPAFDRARLALWDVHQDEGNGQVALVTAAAVPETSPMYARARFSVGAVADPAQAPGRCVCDASDAGRSRAVGDVDEQHRRHSDAAAGDAANRPRDLLLQSGAQARSRTIPTTTSISATPTGPRRTHQSAIFWLREAVRRNPADGEAHAVLAAALQATGATAEAARERELATQLSSTYAEWAKKPAGPGAEPIPRGLERLKPSLDVSTLRRVDSAIATTGQREQKELTAFHLDRGRRFFEQGSNTEAITELRRAIYLSPYEAEAHLLLGRIYLRTGQTRVGHRCLQDRAVEPGDGRRARSRWRRRTSRLKDHAGARAGAGTRAGHRSEFLRGQRVTRQAGSRERSSEPGSRFLVLGAAVLVLGSGCRVPAAGLAQRAAPSIYSAEVDSIIHPVSARIHDRDDRRAPTPRTRRSSSSRCARPAASSTRHATSSRR